MRRFSITPFGKFASAISYKAKEGVPKVVASGEGRDAERIIAAAREAGITVVEDSALAFVLAAGVKPGDYVPPWCWEAVAKILAFVFAKEGR
jgi:flagellar biosynthesis protein